MKKNIAILLAIASMMGETMNPNRPRFYEPENKPVKKPCPAGCKEFTYYGHTVYALNEARAIKKCKKLAGIL
jgi:hypothetical protein